jgi:chromosome segregation protein
MAFVEYVRRAAAEEGDDRGVELQKEKRLVAFPGMELTLGVPCQALLIFDAEFPRDLFSLAMTALAINPSASHEAKIANVERLQTIHSLKQLREKLDEHTYLRDRYIILPNVGENGQFSLLRKGLAGKYIEMPCVGGYVDGSHEKLGDGNRKIVSGLAKESGHKRIALFQTSDSRRADHRDLGVFSTWIKWATPSAEALRQACLAQESRVSQVQPLLPSSAITAISVSNSVFLGPVDLELNFQYNALIGGRGTGKSTLLEYLRWALCDQPPGLSDEDTPNYQGRRARLIEQTLRPVNATVHVSYELNGVPHVVRRDSRDGSLQIKIADSDMRPCSEDETRALLPIQGYSQKQLSGVSVRIDELLRFITAPIRSHLGRITQQAADRAERIRQTYATRRRQRILARTLVQRELEERSLTEQAEAIKSSLTGLSDSDRALIAKGKIFDAADQAVHSWRDSISTFKSGAEGLRTVISSGLVHAAPSEPDPGILEAAREEQQRLLADAKSALEALVARADGILSPTEPTSPWRRWVEILAKFKADYRAAVARSSAHADKMDQLGQIEEHLAVHVRETARLREELRGLEAAETAYEAECRAWRTLQQERDELLQTQCMSLTSSSDGLIRAHVKRNANPSDFISSLRQFLSGSRVQGGKIEALGETIPSAADGTAQWMAIIADLEKLAEIAPETDSTTPRPETPTLSAAGLTGGDIDRIARSLKPEQWLELSLVPIPSEPIFEYKPRENEYIPFGNASAGQQATALLKTLLNQSGPPLIIDQPEEDLDNPVMLEVVVQLWKAKQKRQIIFASHNANLVVNGDAELIAWCDNRTSGDQSRGIVAGEGAIDVPNVREAIERIMEGGKAAFNLRREKYGF